MSSAESLCPICKAANVERTPVKSAAPRENWRIENRTHIDDASLFECPVCGSFAVTETDRKDWLDREGRLDSKARLQLSALLREQKVAGWAPYWVQFTKEPYGPLQHTELVPIHVDELLAWWPRTVPERIDRTLCNFAKCSRTGGQVVQIGAADDVAFTFAETAREARYHIESLQNRGYLEQPKSTTQRGLLTVTPAGWERFEELTRGASAPENPVFVAMWFGAGKKKSNDDPTEADMKALYDCGIEPAVQTAGYRVTRMDLVEHNEWIMDQVLGHIRLAPFIVADFTGHRNGVYFEAGFARGLGIPVIHTCREDHLDNAHFDTRQLNHVRWENPDDMRERLYHRIMGTIGRGPYPPPTATS